ncbi:MAG TPA: cytochrome C biogenesis protein ResC [Nitrospirae bacterium]|nr:cytochrome C biogenesis protein ResC [Nitrospirota bacterium]
MILLFIQPLLYGAALLWEKALFAAITVQAGYLLYRGVTLGRLPLVGLHDTLLFLSLSTAVLSIPFWVRIRPRKGFFRLTAVASLLFSLLGMLSRPSMMPLPPVLKTFWFELHVVLSFLSYGLFGIAAVLGVIFLLNRDAAMGRMMESLQYRAVLTGYLLFSLSMIFGGIWAYFAWGSYWLWTPKELWTTLLWLTYTLYLHLRFRPYWRGARIATIGIAGYGVVLFTYLGVGLLMKSSHSF